jgi:hypothetical protein
MVNVWQHDEREVGHQRRKKAAVDYTAAQAVAAAPWRTEWQYRHGKRTKAAIAEQQNSAHC